MHLVSEGQFSFRLWSQHLGNAKEMSLDVFFVWLLNTLSIKRMWGTHFKPSIYHHLTLLLNILWIPCQRYGCGVDVFCLLEEEVHPQLSIISCESAFTHCVIWQSRGYKVCVSEDFNFSFVNYFLENTTKT